MNKFKFAEQIKEKVSLADHIDKYCTKNGTHWDHGGKCGSASGMCLSVYTEPNGTDKFTCFHEGCNAHGDIIDFTADWHNTDFAGACRILSDQYGVPLDNDAWNKLTDEEKERITKEKDSVNSSKQFMNDAVEWYHQQALKNKDVIQYWKDRGISIKTIQEQKLGYAPPGKGKLYEAFKDKYERVTMEATGLLRDYGSFFDDRYVYPYWNGDQCVYMIGGATKTTKKKKGEKEPVKYVKMACHSQKNPQIKEQVVQHVLYGANRIDKEKPVLVAEGIVDAILGQQELGKRYNVISPVTAKMNNKDIERLSVLLSKLKSDLPIVICNDTERNETGKKSALKTAQDLNAACIKLNPEIDPKDGEDKVLPWRPKILISTLRKDPGLKKVDMADYIQSGKTKELIYWIEAGRTIWEYESYLQRNPNRFFEWNKNQSNSNRFQTKKIVDEYLSEGNFVVSIGDNLYVYRNGFYQRDENGDTIKVFQGKLQEKRSPSIVTNSVKDLVMATQKGGSVFDSDGMDFRINTPNGILDLNEFIQSEKPDIAKVNLLPHTPDYMSNSQIAVPFNPKGSCPIVDKFLSEVLDAEDVPEFWKAVGYTLLPLNEFQKSFLFYGIGGTGKGTAQGIIEELLGEDNYVSQSLEELEKNRFRVAELYGKMANICGELEDKYLPRSATFKKLTGGDTIAAEEKGQKPFSFICRATMFFSSNSLPVTNDQSDATLQRWKFFGFDTKFRDTERQDPFLKHRVRKPDQMEGVLVKALYGLWDLIHNRFQDTRRGSELVEEFREENHPIHIFAQEYLFEQTDVPYIDRLGATKLYRIYKIYHEELGIKGALPSATAFNRQLQKIFPSIYKNKDSKPQWMGLGHHKSLFNFQDERSPN